MYKKLFKFTLKCGVKNKTIFKEKKKINKIRN